MCQTVPLSLSLSPLRRARGRPRTIPPSCVNTKYMRQGLGRRVNAALQA